MIHPNSRVKHTHDEFLWFLIDRGGGTVDDPSVELRLPKDLIWQDEFLWEPVAQVYEYSVEGNLLIQESTKKKGRHITLVGQNDMAWIDRTDMKKLVNMRNKVGRKLILRGRPVVFEGDSHTDTIRTFTDDADYKQMHDGWIELEVMFRHQDTALEYTLIKPWDQFESDSYYIINAIRLMEVLPNQVTGGGD